MKVPRRARIFLVIGMSFLLLTLPLSSGSATAQATPEEMDVDHVVMTIDLKDNGDAEWTVEYRERLATEQEREDFQLIRGMVEQNPEKYETDFESQMNSTLASADESTEREMDLQNVNVSTDEIRFPQTYGIIQYEFTWTNFTTVTENDDLRTLELKSALSGLILDSDTRLVVKWPDEYDRVSVEPTPDTDREESNEVAWMGPIEFESNEPRLSVEKTLTTSEPGPVTNPSDPGSEPNPEESRFPPFLIGGAVTAVLVCVSGYLIYRRSDLPTLRSAEVDDSPPSATPQEGTPVVESDSGTERNETDDSDDKPTDASEPERATEVDLELLSNEEQVLHLLEQNNGRMKQQEVVDKTGWSAAKTSNVLNEMHSNDEIDKFRLGRENVVAKPGESKTDAAKTE